MIFTYWQEPLFASIDNAPGGENFYDNHSSWHGIDEITFDSGGLTGTQWYRDNGPLGMDTDIQEPRSFCTKGGCHFSFNGVSLILRINVAWSWYPGTTILIDGQLPSEVATLDYIDTISCNAQDYGLFGDAYIDVMIADGLEEGSHDVQLLINNPDEPAQFFSIAGFKVYHKEASDVTTNLTYITNEVVNSNYQQLYLSNKFWVPIFNIDVTFDTNLAMESGEAYLTPFHVDSLAPGETTEGIIFMALYAGDEVSGNFIYSMSITAEHADAEGIIENVVTTTLAADSAEIVFTTPWIIDHSTPTAEARAFVSEAILSDPDPWQLIINWVGDALDITIQQSAGWGIMGLYQNSTPAAALLYELDCSVDVGGALYTYNLTGFGPGYHNAYLRKTTDDDLFVVFVKAQFYQTLTYTAVTQTFNITIPGQQPYAMLTEGMSLPDDYDIICDAPESVGDSYLSDIPARTNDDVKYTEVLSRFPTFAVCYQTGYRDILAEYDILIIDPLGAKVVDVAHWQSLGIRVFGYVSSGEEVGFYADRYDFASALAPRPGSGPGGYSENYMFTQNPVSGPPDKDGVWAAYYMDPRPESGYYDRLINYYAPQVFGGQEYIVEEEVITSSVTITAGPRIVFDTVKSPIDADEEITLTTLDGSYTYARFSDYTYDVKTGAFVLSPTISPAVIAGDHLKISYVRKGHNCDGIFWDTVDTPDVYGSSDFGFELVPGYAAAFAVMLNDFGAAYPDRKVIFNRGFTILNDIIAGGHGVMFETWLTAPDDIGDLVGTDYHKITDQPTIDYNEAANQQMQELREHHVFDVYSLNYALPGDIALKTYIRQKDAERGYLSWQSTMTLTNPSHNNQIDTPGPPINTNAFVVQKKLYWDD